MPHTETYTVADGRTIHIVMAPEDVGNLTVNPTASSAADPTTSTAAALADGNAACNPLAAFVRRVAEAGVPDDAELVYEARNRVFRCRVGGGWLSVKAFRRPKLANAYIYRHLRASKARRSFENAALLIKMGFLSPTPVAYIEVSRDGRLLESYYICQHLDGAGDMRHWEDNPLADSQLPEVALLLAQLHKAGIYHKDFSPGNILIHTDPNGEKRLYLIDVNRMEFGVRDRRRLLQNLRAVNIENAAETCRFARLYAAAAGLDPEATAALAAPDLHAYHRTKANHRAMKKPLGRQQ